LAWQFGCNLQACESHELVQRAPAGRHPGRRRPVQLGQCKGPRGTQTHFLSASLHRRARLDTHA